MTRTIFILSNNFLFLGEILPESSSSIDKSYSSSLEHVSLKSLSLRGRMNSSGPSNKLYLSPLSKVSSMISISSICL